MPRKKRVRISAPVRRVMKEAGYSRTEAARFVKEQRNQENNHRVSAANAAKLARQRKEEYVRQSRLGVTRTGKDYLERLEAVEQTRKDLASFGIAIPEFIDLAEAAAEGRYDEALKLNKRTLEKAKHDAEARIDEIKQEMSKLHGDELVEARADIKYLEQRISSLEDMYGSGKALNLKNTKIGRLIDQLFE